MQEAAACVRCGGRRKCTLIDSKCSLQWRHVLLRIADRYLSHCLVQRLLGLAKYSLVGLAVMWHVVMRPGAGPQDIATPVDVAGACSQRVVQVVPSSTILREDVC